MKRDLKQMIVIPMKNPHIFFDEKSPSLRPPCGILLTGPPGTGKTLLAKACAQESKVNFLSLHSAALESKWWGESPKLLQTAFKMARTTLSPCIVFFDEIDGLGRSRSEHDQSCVYSLKCELLRNMDGIDKDPNSAIAVLACTNCPSSIDVALKRRFTRQISVPLPKTEDRLDILNLLCMKETQIDRDLLERVATHSEGMSGADLAALYTEACSHRLWSSAGVSDDSIEQFKNGREFLRSVGPLSVKDWTNSGRVNLPADPHQNDEVVFRVDGAKEDERGNATADASE